MDVSKLSVFENLLLNGTNEEFEIYLAITSTNDIRHDILSLISKIDNIGNG
jgi:hypothetical protein